MARSVLIADTTREEREAIVRQGLSFCGESSCDLCNGCSMGVTSVDAMYRPYIEGEMELAEVNMTIAARKYVHG